jgi:hypothetical protein
MAEPQYGEPWRNGGEGYIYGSPNDTCIRTEAVDTTTDDQLTVRIVACVNALRHVPDEVLQRFAVDGLPFPAVYVMKPLSEEVKAELLRDQRAGHPP